MIFLKSRKFMGIVINTDSHDGYVEQISVTIYFWDSGSKGAR